ncbi:SIR2 family protein [Pseudochrobactrum asaccharolyticum]|uniref:SIR2-like protein n=1 Tax=Pseudochrobactrum asaccharolyticum TaxID=354351 RepID=A0A366DK37_9HYPH|nr:SIR2 family protein [Pseudochrobactrum asaccharolyticum]RBO90442.1 SIR2-like protein [Pseudochrobactrum asaccharolyticum]
MALRFSNLGPEFPRPFIQALKAGEVVFLCGAGISAPQLPGFETLVADTYSKLGIDKNPSEESSFIGGRYEEVLGSLSRRLAEPENMISTVSELLAVPDNINLNQHNIVLRLSRDINNKIVVVTTNFDTLLERASESLAENIRTPSYAGQSLPAPGGASFSGVIHIHGRLEDTQLDLDSTPLILTSADYGDAYMRSGWASRFLFDLARCKTIVLIGYSANDAPVRYFLNVLESDRARFPDLKPVYAFDTFEHDPNEAEARWGTLAVTPLSYCKRNPQTGGEDHSPLWQDLAQLADLVETPQLLSAERTKQMLSRENTDISPQQLRELSWLLSDHNDLWPVVITAVTDPSWFHLLDENKLWTKTDASRVIASWVARNFEDRQRYMVAIEWSNILESDFLAKLDQFLRQTPSVSPFWLKLWRLLFLTKPDSHVGHRIFDRGALELKHAFGSGLILDRELTQAIALLTPVLKARRPYVTPEDVHSSNLRISKYVSLELIVTDEYDANQTIETLIEREEHMLRVLELCTESLRSTLYQAVEIELILQDYDLTDYTVPSIERHKQNEHHNGMLFLLSMIVQGLPKAIAMDQNRTKDLISQWRSLPGRLGKRLMLHAARNTQTCSANEALQLLLDLNETDFWTIRREFALLLRDRAAEADPEILDAVVRRILSTGEAYYSRYSIAEGEVDWRKHSLDIKVWLHLNMLDEAEVLSEQGRAELEAIVVRHSYLNRKVEDSDFFNSYSSGITTVEGDSSQIIEAEPADRLKVATDLIRSPNIHQKMGWENYCRSDLQGAFQVLKGSSLEGSNLELWNIFLPLLAYQNDPKQEDTSRVLIVQALAHLEKLDDSSLEILASNIVETLVSGPRRDISNLENWCDRLWAAIKKTDQQIDFKRNIYERAINCSAGRLVHVLLAELNHTIKNSGPYLKRQCERLISISLDKSQVGVIARSALIHDLAFILHADEALAVKYLIPLLNQNTDEARALRAVLVSHSNITPEITKFARDVVLLGVIEGGVNSNFSTQTALSVLRPAIHTLHGDNSDGWGINFVDVRQVLKEAPNYIRSGMLDAFVRWIQNLKHEPAKVWEKTIFPFFDLIWPKERRYIDNAHNRHLFYLVAYAGQIFPEACARLRPYFHVGSGELAGLHWIIKSKVPENFPASVLDLLWLVCGPDGETNYYMAELLDRLYAADNNIKIDRRFQSLKRRTTQYK